MIIDKETLRYDLIKLVIQERHHSTADEIISEANKLYNYIIDDNCIKISEKTIEFLKNAGVSTDVYIKIIKSYNLCNKNYTEWKDKYLNNFVYPKNNLTAQQIQDLITGIR